MKNTFSAQCKALRRAFGMSQEAVADALGVTAQAVSKWECALSYPDIEVPVALADLFKTTVDRLLRGGTAQTLSALPNDNLLRIVQARGQTVLQQDTFDPEVFIPLVFEQDNAVSVEVWGSLSVRDSIGGSVTAGGDVDCGSVMGPVTAGGDVDCASVMGPVTAGKNINCATVNGAATAGHNLSAADITGDVAAGGNITCDVIQGDVQRCDGSIYVGTVGGAY